MLLYLKISCDNYHVETSLQGFTVLKCIKNIDREVRLEVLTRIC